MGCLREPSHEKFAREFLEKSLSGMGKTQSLLEAYKTAGYVASHANARRLRNRPEVRARIDELAAEACEFADIRLKRVAVEVDRVGRANFQDLWEPLLDKDGNRVPGEYKLRDLTTMPRELTAAIAGLEWTEDGRPKVKMHDRNQANFTLLKHLGGLPDEAPGVTVNILNALTIEDQSAVADLIEAFSGGQSTASGGVPSERGAPATIPETV